MSARRFGQPRPTNPMAARSPVTRSRPRMAPLALPLLLALASLPGCGAERSGSGPGVDVPTWELHPQTTIGSLDDPDLGLTQVSQVVFDGNGLVHIAQSSEREIRAYDLEGTLVRRIGRDGEGPGEFRSIWAMGFHADTLYVSDGSQRRVSFFTVDGEFITSFPWASQAEPPRPPVFYMPTPPAVILPDGSALVQQGFGYVPGQADRMQVPWLRLSRDGSRQDTVYLGEIVFPRGVEVSRSGRELRIYPPIRDEPLAQVLADGSGIAIVERPIAHGPQPPAFRLVRIDPAGDTVLVREYPYDPVATPADELDRQVSEQLERYASVPSGMPVPTEEDVRRVYGEPGFIPEHLPPVTTMRTTQDGWIWLQRERTRADSVAWEAFDPAGERAGRIWLDRDARLMAAREDLIAVLELDEFDVPWVTVYRIERTR